MVDRHSFGDFALAILVALPLVWIAKPQTMFQHASHAAAAVSSASADRSPEGRLSLLS